jgi:2-dehydro-3-deoxyphosphooctonate aldolase (KDO 8-P synthase)
MLNKIFEMPPVKSVKVGDLTLDDNRFFLIAGPCAIESLAIIYEVAEQVREIAALFDIPYIFKASYDKANRTSINSYRGPGINEGLESLRRLKQEKKVTVLTDIHDTSQVEKAAEVADCLQIPAFLCRQTDLLVAAGLTGKAVNIKKGQFMSPDLMAHAVKKVESASNENILLTERGASFGYSNLVVDMRSIMIMRQTGYPVVFDATHSVQLPGGQGDSSGGQREFIFTLSKAAIAAGASGLFIETHPFPPSALSDGPNMLALDRMAEMLERILPIYDAVRK